MFSSTSSWDVSSNMGGSLRSKTSISKSFVNDAPAESLVAIVRAYRGLTSKFAAVSAFSDNVSPSMAKEDESPPDKE